MGLHLCCVRIIRGVERCRAVSSGVERCRAVSSGVEGCRGVSRCRVWHLDTDELGPSLDGVEGCRGVSSWSSWHGVSRCRVSVEVWCRGVEARAQRTSAGRCRRWRRQERRTRSTGSSSLRYRSSCRRCNPSAMSKLQPWATHLSGPTHVSSPRGPSPTAVGRGRQPTRRGQARREPWQRSSFPPAGTQRRVATATAAAAGKRAV